MPKCLEKLFFFHGKFHRSLLIPLSEDLCPELKQNKHEWECTMRARTASVLTARLGRVYAQLLGNVVPRWVAEEAGICRSVAAGVEVKPQHADSRPGLVRVPLGSSVLVHRRARVSQSFHGCHRGHQCNAAFKSIKSERLVNMFYGSWTKVWCIIFRWKNRLCNCCINCYLTQILHKAATQRNDSLDGGR